MVFPPRSHPNPLKIYMSHPPLRKSSFLPNFSTTQRTLSLTSKSTLALLNTAQNEHFGIVPIEAAGYGLPVIACNSGGLTESVIDTNGEEKSGSGNDAGEWSVVDSKKEEDKRTCWLRPPKPELWATAMDDIATLSPSPGSALSTRAKTPPKTLFSMSSMSASLKQALE
jgi:alpha-1,3/alpha-1,6-mannosyltransferase